MSRGYLNEYEKKIMKVIAEEGGYVTVKEIAKKTGMSRQTAKKYLEKLKARGYWGNLNGKKI